MDLKIKCHVFNFTDQLFMTMTQTTNPNTQKNIETNAGLIKVSGVENLPDILTPMFIRVLSA